MKIIATTLAALCLALPATANNAAHTVTFRKMNGTVLQKVEVAHGGATVAPAGPDESADGLTFQRWDGAEKLSCVTNDVTCWALYEAATAKSPSTSIASSSIANRETPYSLDEYFQLYNTLAWSDEFSGSSLSIADGWWSTGKNWNYDEEQRNNELHTYTTDGSNQTVSDGTLKLTAKLDGGSLTSCSIKSNGRVAFKYGRCEIRTKITKTKGMFPAFWMMSNGQTWQNGVEVDVFEQVCGSDWLAANYHIVYQDNSTTQNQTPVTPNDGVHWGDGFHRIGVIVNEREIVYYVDDYIFKRIDVRDTRYDRLRSYPLYIILNLAVGGNWTAAMSGDLSVSSIGDLPAGFTSEDFTIDYCRIFTNATEGKTVARPAEPEGTTLSGPVKATVWRGWQMNSGKSGSEYYKNHLAGTERRHVKTALSEYFTRDKPDIVTFLTLPKITLWNAEKEGEFDIPGTTTLFASANGDGEGAREILMNAVMFDSTRFSASESGVTSLTISDDKAYTNCVAICANLVERESGASVNVVSVNVLSTNDYANLFQTLNSFKDERAIVLFQGFNNTYFMNDAKKKAAAQLQSPYRLLDSVNGPWPSYFFAYATECVSADTEVPAPLSVPKANGQASGVHTNQAFCATVQFEAEPEPVPPVATEAEGLDWTNRLFTVSGLEAGVTVTLTLAAPDGTSITTLTQAADAGGSVSFSPATIPGALHDYTLSAGGETIASGSFMTGAWDAEGSWFSAAPDGNGGSTETGGTWTIPPEKTNATAYVIGSATAFSLTENARAVGEGKFIRAISALRYDFLNDPSDTFSDLALGDSLAAITAVKGTGGAAQWKACVGGAWIALSGAIAPAPDTDYLVRLEGDFTRAAPRVRLSVSDDGGASYAPLSSAATGDEWLVPNNAAATALTGIATDGSGNVAALRGQLSNTWVAEAGGVCYASLADALRAAGRGGTVTLLTSATAPASLAAGRTIIGNGHIFVTYNDWRGTLFFMQ